MFVDCVKNSGNYLILACKKNAMLKLRTMLLIIINFDHQSIEVGGCTTDSISAPLNVKACYSLYIKASIHNLEQISKVASFAAKWKKSSHNNGSRYTSRLVVMGFSQQKGTSRSSRINRHTHLNSSKGRRSGYHEVPHKTVFVHWTGRSDISMSTWRTHREDWYSLQLTEPKQSPRCLKKSLFYCDKSISKTMMFFHKPLI